MRGVTRGNNEIVSALLEAGADANKGIDNGEPPIFIAALLGQIETMDLLIKKGADVNAVAAESGLTALHGAAIGKSRTQSNACSKPEPMPLCKTKLVKPRSSSPKETRTPPASNYCAQPLKGTPRKPQNKRQAETFRLRS
jgi:hypothetical protein